MNCSQQTIHLHETVFDTACEQPIELDYLLADYCPNIFKILKCRLAPQITSFHLDNDKLTIDTTVYIKILYLTDESHTVHCIDQKQNYTKIIDAKGADNSCLVSLSPKPDYCNCRVVNPRRLDIKGAFTTKVQINKAKQVQALCDALGDGLQINKRELTCLGSKLWSDKEFNITEDLELGYGKPPIHNVLFHNAHVSVSDCKLLNGKLLCKAQITLHLLYNPADDAVQTMEHAIPITPILELPGIDDSYRPYINMSISAVDIDLPAEQDAKNFTAHFTVKAHALALKNETAFVLDDAYSTSFPTALSTQPTRLTRLQDLTSQTSTCKNTLQFPPDVTTIYDLLCDVTAASLQASTLQVNLGFWILAADAQGMPAIVEKNIPCSIPCDACSDDTLFTPDITILHNSYTLTAPDQIEIRTELLITGPSYHCWQTDLITQIKVEDTNPLKKDDSAVLRLYFANQNENVWEIAKEFKTDVAAVYAQNGLESPVLSQKQMLLIPIV